MKLYAYTTPEVAKHAGFLKIGETHGDIEKRVHQQGREHGLHNQIVWQGVVITDRIGIDRMIRRELKEQGFNVKQFDETSREMEWVECTVADIEKAFDIIKQRLYDDEKRREEVGNKFYLEIRNWYYWTLEKNRSIDSDYALRLVIRLLFCFFLREKDELVPKELLNEETIRKHLKKDEEYSFYNAVLRNLFFHCLNTPMAERQGQKCENEKLLDNSKAVKDMFAKIPFLNGGLFDKHEKDDIPIGNDYFFSERRVRYLTELDKDCDVYGIVTILSKYQYKLTLDDLLDQAEYEKTVDPEFIGKVFESLLACIDADSKESRRKVTGSYYTPREIVDYMVCEALDAYVNQSRNRKIANHSAQSYDCGSVNTSDLLQCKILDPACGSGAFPCGIMNEIMRRLDPNKDLSQSDRYHTKLKIIQDVIYGVDIQPIAVQISQLRLFLSLIQDIIPDKRKTNYGIEPLPNLEIKFVCADTLIGLKKEKNGQGTLELPRIKEAIKELQKTRSLYFMANNVCHKESLRQMDESWRKILAIAMEDAGALTHDTAEKLVAWDPYDSSHSAPFFDSVWMFGVEKFDIVIGNPPYISFHKGHGVLSKFYERCGYETFSKTGDIYSLFYERGSHLLVDGGLLCFITSNKWMRAGYGESLRKFLSEKTNPKLLLDFAGTKVFESATVDVNILLFAKEANQHRTAVQIIKSVPDLKTMASKDTMSFTSSPWVVLSPVEHRIKEKIESVGVPLKDWGLKINVGPVTGYTDAFVIDEKTKKALVDADARSAEILQPMVRGRDIRRYSCDFANMWLITTFPSLRIDIDQYPAVKKHLLSFGKRRLEQSGKKGARTKTNNKWFETHDNASYYEDFKQPKIIWADMASEPSFVFVTNTYYFNNTCYMLVNAPLYMLGILNSKLVGWYFPKIATGLGNAAVRYLKPFVEKIPIPRISGATCDHLSELVTRRLNGEIVDDKIDALVYELYGLTKKEIAIVERTEPQS